MIYGQLGSCSCETTRQKEMCTNAMDSHIGRTLLCVMITSKELPLISIFIMLSAFQRDSMHYKYV